MKLMKFLTAVALGAVAYAGIVGLGHLVWIGRLSESESRIAAMILGALFAATLDAACATLDRQAVGGQRER